MSQILLKLWLIGNRTSCRPIRFVIILVIKQIGLPLRGRPILLITRMITDRIELHSVLLPLLIIIIIIIVTIIIIFRLRKRVFFNRCLAVWYPFCFSGQAVYLFTAIKRFSRSSSFFILFIYLFIYFVNFHSILSLFLFVFFYVQLACVGWEVTK